MSDAPSPTEPAARAPEDGSPEVRPLALGLLTPSPERRIRLVLGRGRLRIDAPQSVVLLDQAADALVEVCVDDRVVAWGEPVLVEGKIALRVTEVAPRRPSP